MCATVHAWKPEDSLQESVPAFYYYGTGTRVIRLGGRDCYLMSPLASLTIFSALAGNYFIIIVTYHSL